MVYHTINGILKEAGSEVSAAEAHGIATGMLCIDVNAAANVWLSELFGDTEPAEEAEAILTNLFERTRELIESEDYSFDLLLPADDNNLEERVAALIAWCQGFLFGVGYAHAVDQTIEDGGATRPGVAGWPGESGEILNDVVEFTKMEMSEEEGPESEEEDASAFTEINEYLRVAVFLIRNAFDNEAKATCHQ